MITIVEQIYHQEQTSFQTEMALLGQGGFVVQRLGSSVADGLGEVLGLSLGSAIQISSSPGELVSLGRK